MAQYTVDSFIVELGFSEKVVKGLERVEKLAMASAQRIEKNLTKAFNVSNTKGSLESLKRIEKNAQSVSGRINKTLNKSFNIDSKGIRSLKKLETQGKRTANVIRKELNRAANVTAKVKIRTSQSGYGRATQGTQNRTINPMGRTANVDVAQRQMERMLNNNLYSGLTRRLETIGGQGGAMASTFRGNLQGIYKKFQGSGKVGEYELEVKRLIDVTKKWVIAENARLKSVKESAWLQDRANSSLRQLVGGFVSAYAALEIAKQTIDSGIKRQSAQLASSAIFGKDTENARLFAATFGNQIGQKYTDTLKQYANFAAGAQPALGFQGTQDFYKNAAMFSRIRGASDEDLKGIMIAFQQMASKGKIQAEELRGQLGDRLAGALQLFADAIGKTPQELDKMMQDGKLLANEVLPKVSEKMAELVKAAGGMEAVSKQTATSMGQAKSMWDNTLVAIFNGSSEGINQLSKSVAMFLQGSMGVSSTLGTVIGELLKGAGNLLDTVTDLMYRLSSLYYSAMAWYTDLDKGQQQMLKDTGELLGTIVAIGAAVGVVTKAVKVLSGILGGGILGKLASKAIGGEAAGAVAATSGKSLGRILGGAAGLSTLASGSSDPEAAKKALEEKFKADPNFKHDYQNIERLLNEKAARGGFEENTKSNWEILGDNLTNMFRDNLGLNNPVLKAPTPPELLPKYTPTTHLNVSFVLDGKQIANRVVSITDKSREDILLNASYPEEE